jgi:hypothetical protein
VRRYLKNRNNPWEILVIAALFFFPGVFMLMQHGPVIAIQQSFHWIMPSTVMVISAHSAHIFGRLAVGVACAFVWLYFYLRRLIARDIEKPRWR